MIPVSLGIPMYKSEAFLPGLFETLRNLDPLPAEIVLLDDASPDASHELATAFAANAPLPVSVLRNETNQGIACGYNRLAATAQERWVHILDADDHPVEFDFYARVLRHLSDDVSAVVTSVQSNSLALRAGNAVLGALVPKHPPEWWPLLGSFATRSGVIYRRDALLAHPFPDPAYPGSDVVHLLTLRERSRITFDHHAHVFYNVHQGASSSQARDYSLYLSALQRFGTAARLAHKADLAVRRLGQIMDRS
ncbi:glycosyltransferase [Lysobacter soli]|uniref:glycosyltransferase family 2 protein n=1 Tax=Lysobacter soli TaxID=453783 RepID=UPI0012EE3FD6|nr:glycosyltransferase family 2 protein [Lysobacter soli]QGW64062.1 glycosyltransferase [Lysobacter soli]